jgi:carboxyl-terminal processing protease
MMSARRASRSKTARLSRLVALIGAVVLVLGGSSPATASSAEQRSAAPRAERMARPGRFDALGQEIVRLVREKFYDRKAAEAWAAAHDHYGAAAASRGDFDKQTRGALEDLKTSHTGFYTPADQAYYGLLAIFREAVGVRSVEYDGIGADFTPDGFVRAVFAGGPAEKSGLRRGDHVLQAGGKDFQPVLSFRGRAGGRVVLTVERTEGGPAAEVAVTPRRIDPREEWKQAQKLGSKLIRRDGNAIAYVPLFSCAGEEYREALQDSLQDELAEARALILDFRNGWGGCNPDFVSLFDQTPPVLASIGRDGKERTLDSQWRRPLFILINGGTRSGKEVVSYAVRKHRLGKLIGERTAGAVSGGTCFLLSDRSLLFLAVSGVRVDGEILEGRGVDPDVKVEDALPYAAGADPQLDRAIELAARAASG